MLKRKFLLFMLFSVMIDYVICYAGEMVFVPAGSFQMGDTTVYLDAYYIDKYEVTNEEYSAYLNNAMNNDLIELIGGIVYQKGTNTPYFNEGNHSEINFSAGVFSVVSGKENFPVRYVSWYGAKAYANYHGKRLPTEAEWEKAAGWNPNSNTKTKYAFGDTIDQYWCNYGNHYGSSTQVGWFDGTSPRHNGHSWYGCYDMSGNAWEWCSDWYDSTYKVLRGGCWDSDAYYVQADSRSGMLTPSGMGYYCGFRCAKDAQSHRGEYWGGNGHYYELVKGNNLTWYEAKAAAEAKGGYLATITSQAEQDWILNTFGDELIWAWLGAYQTPPTPENSSDYANHWHWITGEKWEYTNWNTGEPNNSVSVRRDDGTQYVHNNNEAYLNHVEQKWNDIYNTFPKEFDSLYGHDADRYLVEYNQTTAYLRGNVIDQKTGNPVSLAEVSILGRAPVYANANGHFFLQNLSVGSRDVYVSKSGYYPVTKSIYIADESQHSITIMLNPINGGNSPVITEVKGNYCFPSKKVYYLNGISFSETVTAKMDWKGHTPGKVKWITSKTIYEDNCSGTIATRAFDMGSDFGENGYLKVVAVADDGITQSSEYTVNFKVIPQPPLVNLVPLVYFEPKFNDLEYYYEIKGLENIILLLAVWDVSTVPDQFPIFGGEEMSIGPVFELTGRVNSDGKAVLVTYGRERTEKKYNNSVVIPNAIKQPFGEFGGRILFKLGMSYSDDCLSWLPSGSVELGCNGTFGSPEFYLPPPVPPGIYWRVELTSDIALKLGIIGWTSNGPQYSGEFDFELLLKGVVGAGKSKLISIEGYLGGGFHSGVEYLPDYSWKDPWIIVIVGGSVTFGAYSAGYEHKFNWPEQPQETFFSVNNLLRKTPFELIPRDYIYPKTMSYGELSFSAGEQPDENEIIPASMPINAVMYPYPMPEITQTESGILAVWIADNTDRNLINRTQLIYSIYENSSWGNANIIDNDGTADMNPILSSLSSGNAVCIWQDSNTVLSDNDSFEDFLSTAEIAVSFYDSDNDSWSAKRRLTNDSYFDRSPCIASEADNDILAVWICNESNDLWGSAEAPNKIKYSKYDATTWSTPYTLASGFGTILDTSLVYRDSKATYAFCVDPDNDFDTPYDQELWLTEYENDIWSVPVQLTSDNDSDAAPYLFFDSDENLRVLWVKGDNILLALTSDIANPEVIVSPGESMGLKDFDVVSDNDGDMVIVWNDVSETYNDIWIAYYDSATDIWSKPRQMTYDDSAERFIKAEFDNYGNLLIVYNKVETEYQDKQVEVDGQTVTVEDVPKAGQSKLCYMLYELNADLSIMLEDVSIDPLNPEFGTDATITAKIKNIGESPVSNFEVAFYDSDPDNGGTIIDTIKSVTGPLVGGGETDVSVIWTVPESTSSHVIFAVVDPDLEIEDKDRSNNKIYFSTVLPDLTISEMEIQTAGKNAIITFRIANEGSLKAENLEVKLYQTDNEGNLIGSDTILELLPGTYNDLSFTWQNVPYGTKTVYAVVDESDTINEIDEGNNHRSMRFEDSDEDNDGLPNWYENANGFNQSDPADAEADIDNDGLTTIAEYNLNTAPRDNDTDGDGLKDGDEVKWNLDPKDNDSFLTILSIEQKDNGGIALTWPWINGKNYHVYWCDELYNDTFLWDQVDYTDWESDIIDNEDGTKSWIDQGGDNEMTAPPMDKNFRLYKVTVEQVE